MSTPDDTKQAVETSKTTANPFLTESPDISASASPPFTPIPTVPAIATSSTAAYLPATTAPISFPSTSYTPLAGPSTPYPPSTLPLSNPSLPHPPSYTEATTTTNHNPEYNSLSLPYYTNPHQPLRASSPFTNHRHPSAYPWAKHNIVEAQYDISKTLKTHLDWDPSWLVLRRYNRALKRYNPILVDVRANAAAYLPMDVRTLERAVWELSQAKERVTARRHDARKSWEKVWWDVKPTLLMALPFLIILTVFGIIISLGMTCGWKGCPTFPGPKWGA